MFTSIFLTVLLVSQLGGNYAGFVEGNIFAYSVEEWLKFPFYDTTYYGVDTFQVIDSTQYEGNAAWNVRDRLLLEGMTGFDSTSTYWLEDTFLKIELNFFDEITLNSKELKLPFIVGDGWNRGSRGIYVGFFDNDEVADTFRITNDTAEVISIEDIEIPYGNVEDAYKIKKSLNYRIWYSTAGSMSMNFINHEWWKPYLGKVKDSNYTRTAVAGITLITVIKRELNNFLSGIDEDLFLDKYNIVSELLTRDRVKLTILLPNKESVSLCLYDLTGRLIKNKNFGEMSKGHHILSLDGKNIDSGVYFLKLRIGLKVCSLKTIILH